MFKLTYKKAGKVTGTYLHTQLEPVVSVALSMLKNDMGILGFPTYKLSSKLANNFGYRNKKLDISVTIHDESV